MLVSSLFGILLGVALVTWVNPLTSAGTWLLLILTVMVTVVVAGFGRMCHKGVRSIRTGP